MKCNKNNWSPAFEIDSYQNLSHDTKTFIRGIRYQVAGSSSMNAFSPCDIPLHVYIIAYALFVYQIYRIIGIGHSSIEYM